jgi:hypothetical protein
LVESTLSALIPGRFPALYGHLDLTIGRLRRWVESCNDNHACVPKDSKLPTRVLDVEVSNPLSVKLVSSNNTVGRYTALSHCWGTSRAFTTTQATLAKRMAGISDSELPATYKEAVAITRSLGIRYLWIDSLCILQDSQEDWENESAKMTEVYSNSYLTIAASSSTGSENGCFASIETRNTSFIPPEFESLGLDHRTASYIHSDEGDIISRDTIATVISKGSRTLVGVDVTSGWMPCSRKKEPFIYRIGAFGRLVDPVSNENLGTRGWTLQERLLSPRVLHCGSAQLYWQCNWAYLAEDGCRFDWSVSDFSVLVKRELAPNSECGLDPKGGFSFIEGQPIENTISRGRWAAGWLYHIQDYSQRKLSFEQDKLPALSGLARMLAEKTGDKYYAGLWERHLHEDLCWRVKPRVETMTNSSGHFKFEYGATTFPITRPKDYRAPSWSWASVDGRVMFKPLDFDHLVSEFINGTVTPAGKDKFGRVSGGWIKMWVRRFVSILVSTAFTLD